MADACRARVERRAAITARVAQTALTGDGCARRALSRVANAATSPAGHDQQASSLQTLMRCDGRTATPLLTLVTSSTHVHHGPANA